MIVSLVIQRMESLRCHEVEDLRFGRWPSVPHQRQLGYDAAVVSSCVEPVAGVEVLVKEGAGVEELVSGCTIGCITPGCMGFIWFGTSGWSWVAGSWAVRSVDPVWSGDEVAVRGVLRLPREP